MANRRDSWIVVDAIAQEIDAQLKGQGSQNRIHVCDDKARIHINGTIDLAALAVAIEVALIEFHAGEQDAG